MMDERQWSELEAAVQLRFSDSERTRVADDLASILRRFDELPDLKPADAWSAGPAAGEGQLREDVVAPGLTQEQALENAPARQHGFFQVPAALDARE